MNWYGMTADELLAAIPKPLRTQPHPDLLGRTPQEVVDEGHIAFTPDQPGCMFCRHIFQELAS